MLTCQHCKAVYSGYPVLRKGSGLAKKETGAQEQKVANMRNMGKGGRAISFFLGYRFSQRGEVAFVISCTTTVRPLGNWKVTFLLCSV